jgi:chemotaxis signal transduction protein
VQGERALEFRIGKVHLAMDLTRVDRVIEVPWAPLPLVRPLVLGLGFDDDRPIVCVSLAKAHAGGDDAVVKAILLAGAARVGWALCVDEVFSLIQVSPLEPGAEHDRGKLPRWIGRARCGDGRTVGWIDADVMMRDLGHGEEAAS